MLENKYKPPSLDSIQHVIIDSTGWIAWLIRCFPPAKLRQERRPCRNRKHGCSRGLSYPKQIPMNSRLLKKSTLNNFLLLETVTQQSSLNFFETYIRCLFETSVPQQMQWGVFLFHSIPPQKHHTASAVGAYSFEQLCDMQAGWCTRKGDLSHHTLRKYHFPLVLMSPIFNSI